MQPPNDSLMILDKLLKDYFKSLNTLKDEYPGAIDLLMTIPNLQDKDTEDAICSTGADLVHDIGVLVAGRRIEAIAGLCLARIIEIIVNLLIARLYLLKEQSKSRVLH